MAITGKRPTPAVRGRDAELELIEEKLRAAASGSSAMLIVEGAAGFGKTRLLREALRMASGFEVRGGFGAVPAADQAVPLGGLFDALFEGSPPILERDALRGLHMVPAERYWLLQDLEDLLERSALASPLLLCVDDLQWGTPGCAAAASALPLRLRSVPIVWLYSCSSGEVPDAMRAAFVELEDAGAERLSLGPLRDEAVVEVVADVIRAEPDAGLVELARRAHGSPFFLVELLRGLLEEDLVQVENGRAVLLDDRLPSRVRETMRDRLARMSPLARRAAGVASVLGRRFSFDSLAGVMGEAPSALVEPLDELFRADLLVDDADRLTFRHDLIREAVKQTLPLTVCRTLQRQAVDQLLASGSSPLDVAGQLAASAEPGDHEAVVTLLRAARALASSDPGSAADVAQRALELAAPDDKLRAELISEIAVLLHAAGRADEGKQFADTALRDVLSAEDEAAVLLSISAMLSISADVRADASRRALALPGLPAAMRARHKARLVANLVGAGRHDEATILLPEVEPVVEASAVPEALFALMLAKAGLEYVRDEFTVWLARTEEAISIGRQAADPVRLWLAEQYRSHALVVLDRPAEAQAIADQGRAACELGRQAVSLRHWDALRGRQLYFAGSLADATAVLEGAYASEERVEVVSVIDAGAVTILGQLALHTGDDQLARACTTTAEAMLGTGLPEVRRLATLFLALQWMARGNPAEAHRLVVELGDDRRVSTLPVYPMDVADPPQLMRIALAVQDDQLAREVLAVAEHRAARNPAVATIVGANAHCRGLLSRSSVELAAAVDAFERSPRPLARASALEDLGCMLINDGCREDGVERLSAALRLYVEMGASWDAMRVRGRLRALGVRRRLVQPARPETGWEALTDSELLVVRQVAQGLTNREVAQQLFVSPHTVSMHLRHAFRKLGIRSRVELARLVAVQAD